MSESPNPITAVVPNGYPLCNVRAVDFDKRTPLSELQLTYRAPGSLEVARVVQKLLETSTTVPLEVLSEAHSEERILYDTLDWSLNAQGYQLEAVRNKGEAGRLILTNARGSTFLGVGGTGKCIPIPSIRPATFAERLESLAGPRALLALANAHLVVAGLLHRDEHGRVDLRMEIAHSPDAMETWVRIHSDTGDPRQALSVGKRAKAAIKHLWEVDAALDYFDTPLQLQRRSRGDFSTKASIAPRPGETLAATLADFLSTTWSNFGLAWAATRLNCDDESLHDLRVILRSTRAVLEPVAREKGAGILRELLSAIRMVARATNEGRDTDVVVAEIKKRFADPALAKALDELALAVHLRVASTITDSVGELQRLWQGTSAHLIATAHGSGIPSATPKRALATESLTFLKEAGRAQRNLCRDMVGDLARMADPTHDQLHELRKQFKRLRYILESFDVPRSAGEVRDIADSKNLQTELGAFQDADVMVAFVTGFLAENKDRIPEVTATALLASAQAGLAQAKDRSLEVLAELYARPGWGPAKKGSKRREEGH